MKIWQADFYRSPQQNASTEVFWDLLICDPSLDLKYEASCPQSQANPTWLVSQFHKVGEKPDVIQVFRPQSLSLIEQAGNNLGIKVEPTRRTVALKKWLQEKQYPIALDKPPPMPLPENLWGQEWRLATLPAGDIVDIFGDRQFQF